MGRDGARPRRRRRLRLPARQGLRRQEPHPLPQGRVQGAALAAAGDRRSRSRPSPGAARLGSGRRTRRIARRAMTTPRTTWLVLPTYNEVENLESLVLSALPVLRASAPGEAHILIVDDCSPDGTGLVADRLAARFEEVHVLHRGEKGGLGQAYLAGFEAALE